MDIADDEILMDFVKETKELMTQLTEVLEEVEGDVHNAPKLATYAQVIDRIVGGASTVAMNMPQPNAAIDKIADYCKLCKIVGFKTSQMKGTEGFYDICIALLMDATDVLSEMLGHLEKKQNVDLKEVISQTMIDRVKWVNEKFSSDFHDSMTLKKKSTGQQLVQNDVDALMAKLGFG